MTAPGVAISVIVPTHNRRASVVRTLQALARQTADPGRFEVIVVADGCSDDTGETLRGLKLPFRLRLIEQPQQGQGKARNEGARMAEGSLLVFLDDDIVPFPGLLDAYLQCHDSRPRHLVLGPAEPVLTEDASLFAHGLRKWWSDHHRALRQPSHRFTYRDMHSGNFSISRDLFLEAGGFDPEFFGRSGEDYEFGIRLLAMGVPFTLAAGAAAFHHDGTDLGRSLDRVRMEGRADVLIGLRHPELRQGTALSGFRAPRSRAIRLLRDLAFRFPRLGDIAAWALRVVLGPLERLRFRRSWRAVHGAVRSYWYCRGVAQELEISAASLPLGAFLDQGTPAGGDIAEIDLADGVARSRSILDQVRPASVRVRLAGIPVAVIPPLPGAEPVRGQHLAALLGGDGYYSLLLAMAVTRWRSGTDGLAP